MFKNRIQRIALICSVGLHLLLLAVYRPLAQIQVFPAAAESEANRPLEPIVFELVETPNDAIQQKPDKTNLLSDKNSIARDQNQNNTKPQGDAYSEGQSQYRVFAGQSAPSGMTQRPMDIPEPEQQQSQTQEQTAQTNDAGVYYDSRADRRRSSKFSRDLLAQTSPGQPSAQRPFTDDLNYNQREFSADALGGVSLNTYAWDFAPYILYMKKRIKKNIYPPPAFMQMGAISGQTVLKFKVMPDGHVTDVRLIRYEGHKSLMETSVIAVKNASPFQPLPKGFPEDYLELTWTFIYSINR